MLNSDRRFGLEIEFVAQSAMDFTNIARRINVIHDGSLRPLQHAGEYVSPPMAGKEGVEEIYRVCEVLKNYGASCENPKTSMHIHLDGKKGSGVLRASRSAPDVDGRVFGFSNKLKTELGKQNILSLVLGDALFVDMPAYVANEIDGITYYSKAGITRKPRLNYTYYYIDKPSRFKWLKNSLYFYTLFSDVMEGIVSNSRRFGNMYCIPLGASYDLDRIAELKTEKEIKNFWYKGEGQGGHYDNSRYHNVNLHSYWDRHGTLEIRSHGGTIDPAKVLLWLRLHQTIADKLEDIEFDELKLMEGTPEEFIKFLDDELLAEYIKRLLGYFSNIKVK